MAAWDDQTRQVRTDCVDEISEVLLYARDHKWGKRAEQGLAGAALKIAGSVQWSEQRQQNVAINDLVARGEKRRAEMVKKITESIKMDQEGKENEVEDASND